MFVCMNVSLLGRHSQAVQRVDSEASDVVADAVMVTERDAARLSLGQRGHHSGRLLAFSTRCANFGCFCTSDYRLRSLKISCNLPLICIQGLDCKKQDVCIR